MTRVVIVVGPALAIGLVAMLATGEPVGAHVGTDHASHTASAWLAYAEVGLVAVVVVGLVCWLRGRVERRMPTLDELDPKNRDLRDDLRSDRHPTAHQP